MKIKILLIILLFYSSAFVFANDYPIFTFTMNDAIVEAETTQKDALLIFTADWCKYCSVMKKDIDKHPDSLGGMVVSYINIDKYPELAKTYNVKKLPSFVVVRHTKELKRKVGYKNLNEIQKWLKDDK